MKKKVVETRNGTEATWPEFKFESLRPMMKPQLKLKSEWERKRANGYEVAEDSRLFSCRFSQSAFNGFNFAVGLFTTAAYHFNCSFIKFWQTSLTFINFNLHLFVPRSTTFFFLPSIQHFHFYLLCFTTFTAMHVKWRVESTGESQSERKFHWRLWGRCVIWLNLFIYIRASSSLHHCDKKSLSFYHRNERNAVAIGCAKITRTAERGERVNGPEGEVGQSSGKKFEILFRV